MINLDGSMQEQPYAGSTREAYAKSLLLLMFGISQEYLAANWAPNLEYGLWETLIQGSNPFVPTRDIDMLRLLSGACGGWWIETRVPDEHTDEPFEFVSTAAWKKHFEQVWVPLGRGK